MFKNTFVAGLKAFVPLVVTTAVVIWVSVNIETFFGKLLKHALSEEYYFNGLGTIVGIVFIFCIGLLVNAWMVKRLYVFSEGLLKKIPIVNIIYSSVQELVTFFDKNTNPSANQAVMCTFGTMKVVGFVTRNDLDGLPSQFGEDDQVLVYIPLSYTIGGLMVSMSKASLTPLDMKVKDAMSLVLTAGMTGGKLKK